MFTKLLTLSALFGSVFSLSIGTVSEQNVTKREINAGDVFPDWVPFKNKHGDELGEFIQVEKKNKVKKRLAPPMNFLMRAVAEPDGDDYFDKSAGESDSEDYFEKKDWSDLHRPAAEGDKKSTRVNHTDISDIDGVVDILTRRPPSPILEALNEGHYSQTNERKIDQPKKVTQEQSEIEEDTTKIPIKALSQSQENHEEKEVEEKKERKAINNEEEESEGADDYDDEKSGKSNKAKTDEDKESEAKKALILSSVDELKERHAEEQKELSERIKGESLYTDEFGKSKYSKLPDRFIDESSEEVVRPERKRKYPERTRGRKPTTKPDYDEYEDTNSALSDKYKIHVLKTDTPSETEFPRRSKSTTEKRKKGKHVESGKISVFKNPQLYMLYDDSGETTVAPAAQTSIRGQLKFSSRYTTTPPSNSNERISLVPAESKEGEPTLFFPKSRKNKKKRIQTTTLPPDSFVAETVTDNDKQTTVTAYDVTAPDSTETTGPGSTISDVTASRTAGIDYKDTTGTDSESTNSIAVTDAVPASSDHEKEKSGDYSKEKGGGREHHSEHSEEHEEHGKKAYEGHHEDTKAAKGHHDKENHLGKYDDHGGVDKHHSEESGHYGDHHHEEHGKKSAKYEESGKHSKGHSTKGSHDIHKKDEYEKKVEFFEEEGDSDEDERHGGYNHEKEHSESGRFKKGNLKAGHEHHAKGDSGHFSKGGHQHGKKGHKNAGGHDSHGKHGQKHFHKQGKNGGSKWIYHHGSPAKTAQLVVIDRRGDQFYHGPHYYG